MKTSTHSIDFAEIKKTTDIVRVVESYGIKLAKAGKEFRGLCPFHKDGKNPNLYVNHEKGVFYCQACGASGSVIDFVMRKEGLDKKEAGLKLCAQIPGVRRAAEVAPPPSQPSLASPKPPAERGISDAERAKLLQRIVSFYARTLFKDRAGYDYLKTRKLDDPSMLEVFQVGYCNGTLNEALPKTGEILEQLKALGVLNKKGEEVFRGRVTVPIFDAAGNVAGVYARNIHPCEPGNRHRYLAGPHRGVFNGACAKTTQTLLVTEAIFDSMAFWQAGFRNAVSLYGTEGWTADHEALIRENGTTEIYLALDNNNAGRIATGRLREKLLSLVKAVHVIAWPEGVKDAADFFLSRSASDFEALLKEANPGAQESEVRSQESESEQIKMTPEGFIASYGSRRYELFAIEKPSPAKLKATIKAIASNVSPARFHFDTVDFFLSRSRHNFIGEAARLFQDTAETIESDLNRLTLQVQSYAEKRLEEKMPRVTLVSESEKAEGLQLGKNADLIGEILRDLEKLGLVGERNIGLAQYIGMTSRKMDDPLAFLTISSSGAGKTYLQDLILSLCPPEDLIKVTSLSNRALFYKGENSLVHKVLAVEEEAGASGAAYALRNLISQKILISETTIKNALTGRMEVQQSIARGPTSVFLTTTNPHPDDETLSRFFVGSVNESVAQTLAILAAQRQNHTLKGLHRKHRRGAIIARHLAFQRLLRPLEVINPFEPLLTYGEDGRLIFRRDQPKFQQLVVAITFLQQMGRTVKRDETTGKEYIGTTLDDIAIANELARELFGNSVDDLPPPSRELLERIVEYVEQRAIEMKVESRKVEFDRRELRQSLKVSEAQLRRYLKPLVDLEYLIPVGGRFGQSFCYRLLYDGQNEGRFVPGLKDVEQIHREAMAAGILPTSESPNLVIKNGTSSGKMAPRQTSSGDFDEVPEDGFHRRNDGGDGNLVTISGNHIPVLCENGENGNGVIRAV